MIITKLPREEHGNVFMSRVRAFDIILDTDL